MEETTPGARSREQAHTGPRSHGMVAGTLVVCRYRLPPAQQPWLHEIRVGTVELPGTDPATWNGHNSEAVYRESTGTVPVTYGQFRWQEDPTALIPITTEQALLPHADKVALFLGPEARALLDGSRMVDDDLAVDL